MPLTYLVCNVPKQFLENDREGFRGLWKKVKPPGKPDNVRFYSIAPQTAIYLLLGHPI